MASNPQTGDHIVKSYDEELAQLNNDIIKICLLYTSPSPRYLST